MIVEGAAGSRVSSGGALARTRKNHAQQTASRASKQRLHVFKTASTNTYSFPSSFCSDDSWLSYTLSNLVHFLIKRKIFYKYLLTIFLVHI